ncbi:MAG: hypothetical protein L0H64_13965, partial [Pseudonocardia sp.]|nr:hypothetical protein [Pseudonocardia sp.]
RHSRPASSGESAVRAGAGRSAARRHPALLVGGGSGVVQLTAMLRHARATGRPSPRWAPVQAIRVERVGPSG